MAWGPQPHQIGNLALARGGGGATLIARRAYRTVATVSDSVPAKSGWLSCRAWGGGGGQNPNGVGGSGGTFARSDINCTPGQQLSIKVTGSNSAPSTTQSSSVTVDGVLLVSAPTGNSSGDLSLSGAVVLGQVTARGGGYGNSGTNGGVSAGPGTLDAGGGAGGENNSLDLILTAGPGSVSTPGGFPGGGGGSNQFGGSGLVVIEFWSAKP